MVQSHDRTPARPVKENRVPARTTVYGRGDPCGRPALEKSFISGEKK